MEIDVLKLAAEGDILIIAKKLSLSLYSVNQYLISIKRKLKIAKEMEMVTYSEVAKLIP